VISKKTSQPVPESVERIDHVHGSPAAKVVVVEYGDFECPSCLQAYPGVKIILRRFGDQLRFVFRHFPLAEVHPHAEMAAEAAEAAAAQGKFWQMHDLLFENQRHLKANSLRSYAQKLELELDRYDREMKEHAYLQRIQEHIASGTARGVRHTPTFFVDGEAIEVSFGMERLHEAIQRSVR
jgi:protein-disulfide isomerase